MSSRLPTIEVMDDDMANILRQKTEVERLMIGFRMWKSARVIMRASIEADHPDWTTDQVNQEIAHRISHGDVPRASQ